MREELPPGGKIYFGTFPSECRPEHVTPAALAVLKKYVDNDSLVIGGQSGRSACCARPTAGTALTKLSIAVKYSIEAGFRPDVDFLLGLPGETAEDRAQSLQLARRLVALGARIHSHAFMPLPGTPLRGGTPSEIEPSVQRALEQMESAGAMYGQWRRHRQIADQLVSLRTRKPV